MKNKKIYVIILIFILVLALAIIMFYANKYNSSKLAQNSQEQENVDTDLLKTTTFKSTSDNPIEMNGIEATTIKILNNLGELQILTTLKNNSNETLNGFFIEMALLDETGNTITTITENSEQKIEAHDEFSVTNYVAGLTTESNISNVKIVSLEKNTLKDTIEDNFNDMEEEIPVP